MQVGSLTEPIHSCQSPTPPLVPILTAELSHRVIVELHPMTLLGTYTVPIAELGLSPNAEKNSTSPHELLAEPIDMPMVEMHTVPTVELGLSPNVEMNTIPPHGPIVEIGPYTICEDIHCANSRAWLFQMQS